MRLVALALLVPLLAPAAAGAATAESQRSHATFDPRQGDIAALVYSTYTADPGEANRLRVSREATGEVLFEDPGATIRAGTGCTARSEHAVVCPPGAANAALADGDDTAVLLSSASAYGGPGADDLRAQTGPAALGGGPGDDTLTGTPDADGLSGGPGADRLTAGAGDDTLSDDDRILPGPDVPASDTYDGGAGRDTVDYGRRRGSVRIDLGKRVAGGGAREADRLQSIENASGGLGPDRITGSGKANEISGSSGRDVIRGGGGDDRIDGRGGGGDRIAAGRGNDRVSVGGGRDVVTLGPGDDLVRGSMHHDRIDAGRGDDRIGLFRAGRTTQIRCGPGEDTGTNPHIDYPAVLLPRDCETVRLDASGYVKPRARLRSLRVAVALLGFRCSVYNEPGCRVRFELRRPARRDGKLLDAAETFVPAGRRVDGVRLRLSPAAQRLLARRKRMDVFVAVRWRLGRERVDAETDGGGFRLRLRAPRG